MVGNEWMQMEYLFFVVHWFTVRTLSSFLLFYFASSSGRYPKISEIRQLVHRISYFIVSWGAFEIPTLCRVHGYTISRRYHFKRGSDRYGWNRDDWTFSSMDIMHTGSSISCVFYFPSTYISQKFIRANLLLHDISTALLTNVAMFCGLFEWKLKRCNVQFICGTGIFYTFHWMVSSCNLFEENASKQEKMICLLMRSVTTKYNKFFKPHQTRGTL